MHIDDWIDSKDKKSEIELLAKAWFILYRLPAFKQMVMRPIIDHTILLCDYEGKEYRIIGCSRMGDIWLKQDISKTNGYDKRVDIDCISNLRKGN